MENLAATPEMAYYCFEVLEHELAITKNGEGNKKRKGAPLAAPDPYAYNIPDDIEWFALPLDYVLALNNIKSIIVNVHLQPLVRGVEEVEQGWQRREAARLQGHPRHSAPPRRPPPVRLAQVRRSVTSHHPPTRRARLALRSSGHANIGV
jgi:hypothetical protein